MHNRKLLNKPSKVWQALKDNNNNLFQSFYGPSKSLDLSSDYHSNQSYSQEDIEKIKRIQNFWRSKTSHDTLQVVNPNGHHFGQFKYFVNQEKISKNKLLVDNLANKIRADLMQINTETLTAHEVSTLSR